MKLLFLGDRDTGKTLFAYAMCGLASTFRAPTIGVDFHTPLGRVGKTPLNIWELGGDPNNVRVLPNFVMAADVVVYFCRSYVPGSLQNVKKVWESKQHDKPKILVSDDGFGDAQTFAIENGFVGYVTYPALARLSLAADKLFGIAEDCLAHTRSQDVVSKKGKRCCW